MEKSDEYPVRTYEVQFPRKEDGNHTVLSALDTQVTLDCCAIVDFSISKGEGKEGMVYLQIAEEYIFDYNDMQELINLMCALRNAIKP